MEYGDIVDVGKSLQAYIYSDRDTVEEGRDDRHE
jgi:hypothetical protein